MPAKRSDRDLVVVVVVVVAAVEEEEESGLVVDMAPMDSILVTIPSASVVML